jgi:DNA-binding GntR family transcriptional regulator
MPVPVKAPMYVTIVNTIQERIRTGVYGLGELIPSESALMAEFRTSRVTVVRALAMLANLGWVEAVHGKGRYVKSRMPTDRQIPDHAAGMLDRDETADVQILSAGPVIVPPRAATALGMKDGAAVIARQRLTSVKKLGPTIELATTYIPVELSIGTDVSEPKPLAEGVLSHLADRQHISWHYATERISARMPSAEESRLLEISRRDPVLTVLVTAFDRDGKPRVAVDVVMAPSRHELDDEFPIT